MTNTPPVCNYEESDYQQSFWEQGGREYEDRAEAIALKRMLPKNGKLMLELGAGAGRNTPRYTGFERIVVLDYSTTQLAQAQEKLARSCPPPRGSARRSPKGPGSDPPAPTSPQSRAAGDKPPGTFRSKCG